MPRIGSPGTKYPKTFAGIEGLDEIERDEVSSWLLMKSGSFAMAMMDTSSSVESAFPMP